MKRKILSLILVFAMTVSLLTVGTGAVEPTYGDTVGHWAESSIDRWSGHGIIQGSNNEFDPNGQLTCAQLATILARLLKLPAAPSAGFSDVAADAWYADAINRCVAAGILNGNGDGTVDPNGAISRERAVVMLGRALGIKPIENPDLTKYGDAAKVSAYAQGYVAAMIEAGIVTGVGGNQIAPKDDINRASTVTILDRAIAIYADKDGATIDAKDGGLILVVAKDVKIVNAPEGATIVIADGATGLTVNDQAVTDDQTYVVPKAEPAKPSSGSSSGGSSGGRSHNYTDVAAKAPTCTEAGWTAYKICSDCHIKVVDGVEKTDDELTLPALDHDWPATWTLVRAATYEEDGEETRTCQRENCGTTDTRSIPKLTHNNLEDVPAKAATCTEDGWSTYKICRDTDCTYVQDHETIPALGHDYSSTPVTNWSDLTTAKHCVRFDVCGSTESITGYYYIANDADLIAFSNKVNAGVTFEGKTIELTADISHNAAWTPIGTSENPFKGTFDGKNKTITGLTISGGNYAGLFGVLDAGTIQNVKLASVNIVGGDDVGAVVGRIINNGKVDNVQVLSGSVSGAKRVGGVVGSIKAYGSVINSSNAATVNANTYNVGGIVGAAYYTVVDQEMSISNCTNTGVVTSSGVGAGGIVGLSAANITECENSAAITGNGTSIGGIVGEQKTYGSVVNCTNSGNVTNSKSDAYGTGGIIGWLRYHGTGESSAYAASEIISVTGNSNSGDVAGGNDAGGNDAGGIIGTCYNSAVITGNVNTAGTLSATTFAAGIVGNYQTTETPAAAEPASNRLTFADNTSTTEADAITASCTDLLICTNGHDIAWIGDTYFNSLAAAIAAAQDGQTVTLANNVTVSEQLVIDKNITLDLNGKTLTGENSRALRVTAGKLNLTGTGTVTSTGIAVNSSVIRVGDDEGETRTAELVIGPNVTINAPASYGVGAFGTKTNEKLTIYGTICSTTETNASYDGCAVTTLGTDIGTPATIIIKDGSNISATHTNAIYLPAGTLTVEGGEITGTTGIYFKSTNMTISGGTINGNGASNSYEDYHNGGISTGEAVTIDSCNYPGGIDSVSISGGVFSSANASAVGSYNSNGGLLQTGFITGGTYNTNPSAYLAVRYKATENNGIWTVEKMNWDDYPTDASVTPEGFSFTDSHYSAENLSTVTRTVHIGSKDALLYYAYRFNQEDAYNACRNHDETHDGSYCIWYQNTYFNSGITFNTVVELECDIDFENETLPSGMKIYGTTFKGNRHTIKNATVLGTAENNGNAGLFYLGEGGASCYASIENLKIDSVHVETSTEHNGDAHAGIVVSIGTTSIKDVTVTNSSATGGKYTGAIAGFINGGSITGCTVQNCPVSGQYKIGGVVGQIGEGAGDVTNNTLTGVTLESANVLAGKTAVIGKFVGDWNVPSGNCYGNSFDGTTNPAGSIGKTEPNCTPNTSALNP